MLWYGYIYYFLFFLLLLITLIAALRVSFLSNHSKNALVGYFSTLVISTYVTFALVSISVLYYLLDNFSTLAIEFTSIPGENNFLGYAASSFLLDQESLGLHLTAIYCFPFIYIFVLITVLSILFCLSYNVNELNTFFTYCPSFCCCVAGQGRRSGEGLRLLNYYLCRCSVWPWLFASNIPCRLLSHGLPADLCYWTLGSCISTSRSPVTS